ncbi:MAG: ImmA/IrrE family metallo-endopeptidase [Gluconobacter cerinus]|uniref:ImmA/IrrE family metallo-endopeptidase n=1 Tax=Gluconobacter cerinus TaxID=38307 RepID=UPI0039ED6CC1
MYEQRLAKAVRAQCGALNTPGVDLEAIARANGIQILDLNDGISDGASGWFRIREGRPVILINRQRSLTHQRFTLAHELGHFFMGHGERDRDTKKQLRKRDPVEFSANRFAAAILMPSDLVEDEIRRRTPISEMATLFGVSEEAMGYRLQNLGYKVVVR